MPPQPTPEPLYALDAKSIRDLTDMLNAYRRGELRGMSPRPQSSASMFRVEFGKPAAVIAGVTAFGGQPAGGTINVYTMNSTGNTTDSGYDVTAYNLSTVDVTTDQWVQLLYHERSQHYLIHGTLEGRKVKDLVRFELSSSFNQTNSSVSVRVTTQYGLGLLCSTTITARNIGASDGNNLFAGSTSHAGYVIPTSSTDGNIIIMECT